MNINMPKTCEMIIDNLISNGHEAYIVGGCVRDSILGRTPNDWDICTSAKPDTVKTIFEKFNIIETGLKHGTVTLVDDDKDMYEITTYRVDGKYSDNRRPDNIKFTDDLIEDLSRRDFTINAIAYNQYEGLIDPFGGINDINNKMIKCVGIPDERFKEDALRMFRAIRFKAQLNFKLDSSVWMAIHANHDLVKNISVERISWEINKILLSNPLEIYSLNHHKLLKYTIPELDECFWTNQDNPYHCYSVGKHLVHSVKAVENKLYLKLTMLLHDIGKPQCKTIDEQGIGHFYGHAVISSKMAVDILRRMKYDSCTIMKVKVLILYHDAEIQDTKKSIKKWLNKIGEDMFRDLLKVREADIKAQSPNYYQERHDKLERVKVLLDEVIKDKECFSRKDLAINGFDLIKLGITEGKDIGKILDILVNHVIENPNSNNKKELISIVNLMFQ
ncbi:MAG: HD domain-containing protein [Bacilli bacterium]